MKHPQVVVFERDGKLGQLLRATVQERLWALHEPRQLEPCLRLLELAVPTVLVLKIGGKLEQELGLLERSPGANHELRAIVVGDVENDALAELAWDLGASFALFPPQSRELFPAVVVHLMQSAIGRQPGREERLIAELDKEAAALPTRPLKPRKDRRS
jgi:hypothetical protein